MHLTIHHMLHRQSPQLGDLVELPDAPRSPVSAQTLEEINA